MTLVSGVNADFCYSDRSMNTEPEDFSQQQLEANIKGILEWLALAHGRTGAEDADQLLRQLMSLRDAPVPANQRIKLLDMLYAHAERIVFAELPQLQQISLPVSRKLRQRIKTIIDLLATLTQDYFNTLADLFDPRGTNPLRPPHLSLRRAMYSIAWQIQVNYLVAAPTSAGLWQQLHGAFRTARRLGLDEFPGPKGSASVRRVYTDILLAAIAQPASFSAAELNFIREYIEQNPLSVELLDAPPLEGKGVFWVDLDKDFSPHALVRRLPAADARALYFSCDALAEGAARHRAELKKGIPATVLGLPEFAETTAGHGVLRRLVALWGNPAKRKFPRRRQTYRANLCLGLNNLWRLIKNPETPVVASEWMVTNESPDGFALMHMSGVTEALRIGDIVALQAMDDRAEATPIWHICITRWVVSENPEHIELGLELLAPRAIAAEIAQPRDLTSGRTAALLLPETPPLHPTESLVLPSGTLKENSGRIVVMVEGKNLEIREVRTTQLNEQSSSIEVFSVATDDSP